MHLRTTYITVLLTALLLASSQAGWARPAPMPEDCTPERLSGAWAGASFRGKVLAVVILNKDGTASVKLWNDGYLNIEGGLIAADTPAGIEERSETFVGKWRMFKIPVERWYGGAEIRLDVSSDRQASWMPGWVFSVIGRCSHYGETITFELTSSKLEFPLRIEISLSRPHHAFADLYHYERFLDALRGLR